MLVDSSVWIDFFNDVDTPQVDRLIGLLAGSNLLIGDLVRTEVLQGIRDEREFERTRFLFERLNRLTICDDAVSLQAARNYRDLRSRGITIRKTIDTLIATRCILDDIALLYSDRDFDPFVTHLGLRSALDEPL